MNTITLYYCSFCDSVNNFFRKLIELGEVAGTYRAASQLSSMGYNKEAKELIMSLKKVD